MTEAGKPEDALPRADTADSVPTRATPLHCPYCGDEDLRPEHGTAWLCSSCRRVFTVKFIGLQRPEVTR